MNKLSNSLKWIKLLQGKMLNSSSAIEDSQSKTKHKIWLDVKIVSSVDGSSFHFISHSFIINKNLGKNHLIKQFKWATSHDVFIYHFHWNLSLVPVFSSVMLVNVIIIQISLFKIGIVIINMRTKTFKIYDQGLLISR